MGPDFKSKNDLLSYENVYKEVEMLREEMHHQVIILIRNEVGSIQGLEEIQVYMNFKLALMNLHVSLRPKESSWPMAFLEVFTPNSDWHQFNIILKKAKHVEKAMRRMEGYFLENGYYIKSSDDKSEYVESNSKYNESIDNDVKSHECEDEDS